MGEQEVKQCRGHADPVANQRAQGTGWKRSYSRGLAAKRNQLPQSCRTLPQGAPSRVAPPRAFRRRAEILPLPTRNRDTTSSRAQQMVISGAELISALPVTAKACGPKPLDAA
jgi:hypothetical protein